MGTTSISVADAREIKNQAVRGRAYAGRVSLVLALRMLGLTKAEVDPFSVMDELDYLEGIKPKSKTKGEEMYRHPPLHPLWHKHFSTARHLITNLRVRWGMDKYGNKDLDRLIEKVQKEYGEQPDVWGAVLAHELVVGGYEQRQARGLTGDWIVFAKHEGRNYYLDLATHQEGRNPHALFEKIKNGTCFEFGFLFANER